MAGMPSTLLHIIVESARTAVNILSDVFGCRAYLPIWLRG